MGFAEIEQLRSVGGRPSPTEHIVHFYEDEQFFVGELTSYVVDGLGSAESVIVIATPAHRAEMERRLVMRGIDLAGAAADGTLIFVDAETTLGRFMLGDKPDARSFEAVIEGFIEKAAGPDGRRRVRAFGEMVALLTQRGMHTAAMDLERLWTLTARRLSFSLLCAYPVGLFREERSGGSFRETAAAHDRVIRSGRHAPLASELQEPRG